jgi:hypothetical protein
MDTRERGAAVMAELVPPVVAERAVRPLRERMRRVRTAPLCNAAIAGSITSLVLAATLAHLNLNTLVSLIWTCVSLILLAVAAYDVLFRWSSVDLAHPYQPLSHFERRLSFVLSAVWPEVALVAGIVGGHYLWP